MKADLTRNTFNPFKHYARVLMQQGRVQLDADWNEQAAILLHYMQTLAADLIGPAGGPIDNCAFQLGTLPANSAGQPILTDFAIGLGRYYVDGVLCEVDSDAVGFVVTPSNTNLSSNVIQVDTWSVNGLEFASNQYVEIYDDVPSDQPTAFPSTIVAVATANLSNQQLTLALPTGFSFGTPVNPRLARVVTYLTQPDYPVPATAALALGSTYQVYLDVWERHITYVEDDSVREVALGGPDTATRSKIVWQVRTMAPNAASNCMPGQDLNYLLQPPTNGRLRVRAKQSSPSSDPCIIAPNASYQGPENQLYRVEINRGGTTWDGSDTNQGTTAATFKWSRENGSVVFPIVSGGGTNLVVLENLGRDDRFSLSPGDLVEIQDDASVLLNLPVSLLTVQSIDRASFTVTLSGTPDKTVGSLSNLHPLLRRWDQKAGDPAEGGLTLGSDNAALIQEGVWLSLEDGVDVFFDPLDAPLATLQNVYRTSDYWLAPARTATGDVEWPRLLDSSGNPVLDANGSPIPLAKRPDGIVHHYAPLAVITVVAGQELEFNNCLQTFPIVVRNVT